MIIHFVYLGTKQIFFPLTVIFFIILSVLMTRGNFHYALFAYPAFLLLTVNIAAHSKNQMIGLGLLFGWVILMLPQYGFLAWKNHSGRDFEEYISSLKQINLPLDAKIYGMPEDYFAYMAYKDFRTLPLFEKKDNYEAYIIRHQDTIYQHNAWKNLPELSTAQWLTEKYAQFYPRSGGMITVWHIRRK